jgi:DNA topoisomerase-2
MSKLTTGRWTDLEPWWRGWKGRI